MWERVLAYFSFTRKERLGVLALVIIIIILFVLPYFFRPANGSADPEAYQRFESSIKRFQSEKEGREDPYADAAINPEAPVGDGGYPVRNSPGQHVSVPENTWLADSERHYRMTKRYALFDFDPNKIPPEDWRRLGLSDRLIRTIIHYTQKGGVFRTPSDLKKIYGMDIKDYERLAPYVRIRPSPGFPQQEYPRTWDSNRREKPLANYSLPGKTATDLDINESDSLAWSRMPGIGIRLACRIIHFRERLGGFYSVDQVGETYGLPDSVFQQIRPYLHIRSPGIRLLNLNTAPEDSLRGHPYIGWRLARAIVQYRLQHGPFASAAALQQLAQMDSGNLKKLEPYLAPK